MEQEVIIDKKGRVLIPKEVREKVGLQAGGKAMLRVEKEELIITPLVLPEGSLKSWKAASMKVHLLLTPWISRKCGNRK